MTTTTPTPRVLTLKAEKALTRHQKAQERRLAKYREFGTFHDAAQIKMADIARDLEEISYFLAYDFVVQPGGIEHAQDRRTVEVYFGHKPYDSTYGPERHKGGESYRSIRLHTEQGASLRYELTDAGKVLCLLYPARSERIKPLVSVVLMATLSSAKELNERTLTSHLRYLAAFMAHTSLDGDITWPQRIRYAWLYSTCRFAKARRMQPPRLLTEARRIAAWALTIGCSGLLLLLFQTDNVSPTLERSRASAERQSTELLRQLEYIREAERSSQEDSVRTIQSLERIIDSLEAIQSNTQPGIASHRIPSTQVPPQASRTD